MPCSPIPSSTGDPWRATTILSGSAAETTARPYVPSTCASAAMTRSSRVSPGASSMRCASTSVSVSPANSWPARSSCGRNTSAFSMIPLCTTASTPPQSPCGWALTCVGAPCVAQRVCAMPHVPAMGVAPSRLASAGTRPASLRTSTPPGPATATPAES